MGARLARDAVQLLDRVIVHREQALLPQACSHRGTPLATMLDGITSVGNPPVMTLLDDWPPLYRLLCAVGSTML
ncbi:hypothetical protein EMIT043CA1_50040 [Pseudomonas brassicacearum]